MYWLTADTHFGHENIIKYCKRPFKSAYEMDLTMIRNWNLLVKPQDTVFHLGDLVFKNRYGNIREHLNGNIVHIQGNHDNKASNNKTVIRSININYGGYDFCLVHNPSHAPQDRISLVGHVHEKWTKYWNIPAKQWNINVGVDVWNFHPVKLDTIIKYMERNGICPLKTT